MSSENKDTASWLVPALIGGVVAIAAIIQGCQVATSSQREQKTIEVAKIKADIIKSANSLDFATARVLFVHSLKPLDDETSLKAFEHDFEQILNDAGPKTNTGDQRASLEEVTEKLPGTSADNLNIKQVEDLVKNFDGDERLAASNRVVELYNQNKTVVVKTLLENILPDSDALSYRRNLYIAFTFARIRPYWEGSKEQLDKLSGLKQSKRYGDDETFKKRVDEAINNHKLI